MIKNYTSTTPAETSISRITKLLVKNGANNILSSYDDNHLLKSMTFVKVINNQSVPFKIEAKVQAIYELFLEEYVRTPSEASKEKSWQQAERTAWKLLADWIEIEMALIALNQSEFIQSFLPYVFDQGKGQTFFETIKESKFKLLTS